MSDLKELQFTVSGRISKPCAQVYDAVADPEQLSQYFTTGGAKGQLVTGAVVQWDFHDFPGAFPVVVLEAFPAHRIVIAWDGREVTGKTGKSTVTFEFKPVPHDASRTLVTITESSWQPTEAGAKQAFGNCEGWTGMLAAMKVWLEHGINLREGFYA